MLRVECLHDYKGWVRGHTAVVVFLGHENIAIVSPVGGPGVLDQPIGLSVHHAIANGQNCVVKVIWFVTYNTGMFRFILNDKYILHQL